LPNLTSRSVTDLLAAFRSPDPTPGGGSAAALAAAAGASVLAMAGGLPKSRAVTAQDSERLAAAGARCAGIASELERLIDRDSDAYDLVMAAYRRPKTTDEEKAARSTAIQAAMREAIAAPLALMRAASAAAEQGVVIAGLGNPAASSDVLVGFELLAAGLRGGRLNVETNLASVKDADYVAKVRAEAEEYARAIEHETEAARRALPR
jgi:methenyltetrahydrofolate cyclohydrolase